MLAIWYHDKVVVNLVYFNSFKANTFENNDFVLFCIKLDTPKEMSTKQMHTRALRTHTETDLFFIDMTIVYLGDRIGTTLQSGFEVI